MMKRIPLAVTLAIFLFAACRPDTDSPNVSNRKRPPSRAIPRMASSGPYSQFIPIDSANKMIKSYLTSINYPSNDSDLQSLIFSSDSLRKYINDTSIINIKISLAHNLNYINNGGEGQACGYQTGEFTVIISGYDRQGNYVYHNQNMVLEYAMPCPNNCPTSGTASSPTFTY